jgi:hypothetical protein
MNRSELFANYDNFGKEITTVSQEEFYSNFNKDTYYNCSNGNTCIQKYAIDGYDYYVYSTVYNVGWEGDMDADQYFCKVKTLTKAEIDDLHKLCMSPGFGY